MKTGLLTTIAVATALISSPVSSAILFDVDFSEPLHTDGQPITIDNSINTPSSQTFGSTEMVVDYAGLAGNWAIFNQSDCSTYDQVRFDLPSGLKEVYFEADIYPQNLSPSDNAFSIFTDSTGYGARSTSFHGSGNLRVFNDGVGTNLGSFSDDQRYHLKIHANATYDSFTVEFNGAELYTSTLGSGDITSFRLSMSPSGSPTDCTSPVAAVSNIIVYETPEDLLSASEPEIAETQIGSLSITLLYLFAFLGISRFIFRKS